MHQQGRFKLSKKLSIHFSTMIRLKHSHYDTVADRKGVVLIKILAQQNLPPI